MNSHMIKGPFTKMFISATCSKSTLLATIPTLITDTYKLCLHSLFVFSSASDNTWREGKGDAGNDKDDHQKEANTYGEVTDIVPVLCCHFDLHYHLLGRGGRLERQSCTYIILYHHHCLKLHHKQTGRRLTLILHNAQRED